MINKPKIKINTTPKSEREHKIILVLLGVFAALLFLVLCTTIFLKVKNSQKPEETETVASISSVVETKSTDSIITELTDTVVKNSREAVKSSYTNLGIIRCEGYINFRSAPTQNDITNIMGKISDGAAVDILDATPEGQDGWMQVRSGGMDGYIASKYVVTEDIDTLLDELVKPRATIIVDKLRLRSTPEIIDGNTIGSAASGEKYRIINRAGTDWIEVAVDNIDGVDSAYMSASPENVSIAYGLDEARTMNLRQKVLNMYDNLGVSKASDYINIRKTPEEDGINNIVGKFPGYAGADILGEENGWYKIKSGSVTGYVRADLVATGEEAQELAVNNASVMAIINTDSLNVRANPSTDSQAWTQVTKNQRYNVANQLDGWVQLELDTGDDENSEQGAYVSTRDNNVEVTYALQEAVEYYPAVEAANAAAAFRNKIVNFACQFVGNRYVWGGTSLTHGADCSGFTQSVLKNFGIYIPRVSRDQAKTGTAVTSANMRPGDLIFYANRSGTINHVGMYIGNGQVVNAASTKSGIRIYRWNYRTPVRIRNVIGD